MTVEPLKGQDSGDFVDVLTVDLSLLPGRDMSELAASVRLFKVT